MPNLGPYSSFLWFLDAFPVQMIEMNNTGMDIYWLFPEKLNYVHNFSVKTEWG